MPNRSANWDETLPIRAATTTAPAMSVVATAMATEPRRSTVLSAPRRHAAAHYQAEDHPVIRSVEPGEAWRWCYADEVVVRVPVGQGSRVDGASLSDLHLDIDRTDIDLATSQAEPSRQPCYRTIILDLLDILENDGLHLSGVLVSHHHPDHTGGNLVLRPATRSSVAHTRSAQNQRGT